MNKNKSLINDLKEHKEELIKIAISAMLFAAGLITERINFIAALIIYICSYCIVGYEVLFKAMRNIFHGEVFDECFLMTVASLGAFVIKSYEEAVAVMLFYQIGEFLQDLAVDRSKNSITALMDIRPDRATVIRDGKKLSVDPSDVQVGETIVILPGEKVPLDSVIIDGFTSIDTCALTGESIPRECSKDDNILSGCVNLSAVITARVVKPYGESTVSKILELVENAQENKAKTESFITKFAKVYTPAVVVSALLIALLPPLFIESATFGKWIYKALSFLVISCPCALVISVPLSFFGGLGAASKNGILIKGGNYLEALSDVKCAVFDKTGTLTKGCFSVQKINCEGCDEDKLLETAAHVEMFSTHPIAKSLLSAYGKKADDSLVKNVREVSGKGIIAEFNNAECAVGNDKLMTQLGINYSSCNDVGTVIYIAENGNFLGSIVVSDEVKADSKEAVQRLKKLGITKTVMLTGDSNSHAEKISSELGIDETYSQLLPADKVEKINALIKRDGNEKVAYIGDGINDAPVLAACDVGIAMGTLGSDAAIEAANIVLMTDEPSRVADAIIIARKTKRIAKQNIVFALSVKGIILILSVLGFTTMWAAVFADVGVALLAVLNALRAMKQPSKTDFCSDLKG